MSTPEDIVGLVKELQAEHQEDMYLHCTPSFSSDMPRLNMAGPYTVHIEHLHNHFPVIAQSFLEMVAVLEKFAAASKHPDDYEPWDHDPESGNYDDSRDWGMDIS